MLRFLVFRRYNFVDIAGIGLFVRHFTEGQIFFAFLSIISVTILSVVLERKAFGSRPAAMDDHNKR